MKEIKYAVSGSHGFIGEHLVSRLGEEHVTRLSRQGFSRYDVDGVFDLAAFGNSSGHTEKDVTEIYTANLLRVVELSRHLLTKESQSKFLIYISTSSVTLPHQTYYSASKKATEEFLQIYARENNYPVAIVRPYSVTGPGEQAEHLIPKLIHSCMTGEEMPFVGEPVHDFIDVRDFVDALLVIRGDMETSRGDMFSIGRGVQYTNEQVKDIVESVTGKPANLKRIDSMRSYDVNNWVADTYRIKELGWRPKYTLGQSITDMVNEYEKEN